MDHRDRRGRGGRLVYSLEQAGWHHRTGLQKADGEGYSVRNHPSKNLL